MCDEDGHKSFFFPKLSLLLPFILSNPQSCKVLWRCGFAAKPHRALEHWHACLSWDCLHTAMSALEIQALVPVHRPTAADADEMGHIWCVTTFPDCCFFFFFFFCKVMLQVIKSSEDRILVRNGRCMQPPPTSAEISRGA